MLKEFFQRRRERAAQRRYNRARHEAMMRASNGEYLPRRECEELDLPEWCAHPMSTYKRVEKAD